MGWKSLSLTDAEVAANGIGRIQDAFEALFMASGCPRGMGLLMNNDPTSNATVLYLSPGAIIHCSGLLSIGNWQDCHPPALQSVGILVSAESIESLLSR